MGNEVIEIGVVIDHFRLGGTIQILNNHDKGKKLGILKQLYPGISAKDLSRYRLEAIKIGNSIHYRCCRLDQLPSNNESKAEQNRYNNLEKRLMKILETLRQHETEVDENQDGDVSETQNREGDEKDVEVYENPNGGVAEALRFYSKAKKESTLEDFDVFLNFVRMLIDTSEMEENLDELRKLFIKLFIGKRVEIDYKRFSETRDVIESNEDQLDPGDAYSWGI